MIELGETHVVMGWGCLHELTIVVYLRMSKGESWEGEEVDGDWNWEWIAWRSSLHWVAEGIRMRCF